MEEKLGVIEFWENLSFENRTKLLKENNCWEGVRTYIWKYLPTQIQIVIEEEFEKTRQ